MIDPDFTSNDKGKPGVTRGRKTMDPCGTARLPFCCTDVCCAKAEPPPFPGERLFPLSGATVLPPLPDSRARRGGTTKKPFLIASEATDDG